MTLSAGTRLGPYEVLALIGAGGMGEVYRARDTRLDRDVAVKILPEGFTADADRVARFQREAKVLASLSHPNIAIIHGLEHTDGAYALVMELVEGDDLAQRIAHGPVPLAEALPIAKQIADALEAAHEHGVVHRDLKPANIKVKADGTVKVLDFGLAKALDPTASGPNTLANSPTLSMQATQAGVILGTAAYMSPEQARGKTVDKRADIWAFGVVLYELLTGERLFKGDDVSETLAQVLTKQPDFERVPANTRRLLRECLEKDPKNRLRDIGDAKRLLDDQSGAEAAALAPERSRFGVVAATVAAVTTLIALVLAFAHFRAAPPPERALRYTVAAPENSTIHSFAVSPDGRSVTIAAAVNGKRQLWLRVLDALQAQPVPGTEDATFPFWSPDSRYIGFFAQDKLKKIAASGGPAQSLCNAPEGRGGSWSREDVIVFSPSGSNAAIERVSAAGGVPSDVTRTGGLNRFPVFLPDGRHFLYVLSNLTQEKNGVYLGSVDGNENRRVLADESSVVFAPPAFGRVGHILFIREGTLMAQPFDAGRAQTSGDVFPVAEGISFINTIGFAPVTVSENGVLLYGSGVGSSQIVWFDRAGKLLGSLGAPGAVWEPTLSPDEKTVAFRRSTGSTADIWLWDLARGTDTRLTTDASANLDPSWSPNGDRIVFNSNRGGGSFNLYQRMANGSGQDELLLSTPNTKVPDQWSRDGRFIVYSENDPKTKWNLWVLPVGEGAAGDGKPIPFLKTEFNELKAQLSLNGRWMAYTSDESGQREVYVRPFPVSQGKWRISTAGGEQPRWRGDGKELFFVGGDGKMTAVTVKAETGSKPSFEVGAPTPLFETHIGVGLGNLAYQYDVTADGKRFVVATNVGAASTYALTVVVNWPAALKK